MSTWNLDKAHSVIGFKVRHLMVSTVRGHFKEFEGSVESADDSFENAKVQFAAQVASIDTSNAMRDDHLRSADFFDAENHPTLSFASTSIKKNGNEYEVAGDLTIRGTTKSVTLKATHHGIGTGMDGGRVSGADITGTISRKEFGLVWNAVLETGAVVVGDEVTLDIHVEAKEA